MRIGYFMNSYPMTSTTFIRREIAAIEALGVDVSRYAIRPWPGSLVDPADIAERARTEYLLTGRMLALILGFFWEVLNNPWGIARALGAWAVLLRNAGGGTIAHVAYLLEAVSLKQKARRDEIAHLHTHFSTNSAAVALLSRRLGGPQFSFTAHGPDEFMDWHRSSLALKVTEARFVVAISHYCRVQLLLAAGMVFQDKIHIVRCGIDPNEFRPSDQPFDAVAPFVSVGRLCPQKAQVWLVEAAAIVFKTHPDLRVLIIGDGESRSDVEAAIARHNLEPVIQLLGWRNTTEVQEILGQARALLLPSAAEGLPIVIMEALALGRPAISTFIAGIPELLDMTCGWIIPAGSVEESARAMIAALDTPSEQLSALGKEGRRRVLERHDLNANARELLCLMTQTKAERMVRGRSA